MTENTRLEWNAEKEQWELDGQPFKGEILWCNGWHDTLNIHDPWWCTWLTECNHTNPTKAE